MLLSSLLGASLASAITLQTRGVLASGDIIRGVNIGGWLLTEQWITPGLYGNTAADEWHLCNALGRSAALSLLQNHWATFYTYTDLQQIKAAGLNSVRIPIGYWAVDLQDYEPYVQGQFPYLIQAVYWAQQLGLNVLIDLHGAPGSQNGYLHSGLIGPVLFSSNTTNGARSINVFKNLTVEFSKSIYGGVVSSIEVLNEPRLGSNNFTMDYLKAFYASSATAIWSAASMNVTFHDAFWGVQYWSNYSPSNPNARLVAPNTVIDTHQYYAFPPLDDLPHDTIIQAICNMSQLLKATHLGIPPTVVGEWSLETGSAPNATYSPHPDSQERRTWFRLLFEAQAAAYTPNGPGQPSLGWYYWCWKTQWDIDTWSYRAGVSNGYIPRNVSNRSTYVFPLLGNGCIDGDYNYTAPLYPGSSARTSPSIILSALAVVFQFTGYCSAYKFRQNNAADEGFPASWRELKSHAVCLQLPDWLYAAIEHTGPTRRHVEGHLHRASTYAHEECRETPDQIKIYRTTGHLYRYQRRWRKMEG